MEIFGVESLARSVLFVARKGRLVGIDILFSWLAGPLARDIQEMDEVMPPLIRSQ